MNENPYQVFGRTTSGMRGRTDLLRKLQRNFAKESPDHVSVVGHRYYGKTVFLSALARAAGADGVFLSSIYVDLGHNTPQSDQEFRACIAESLKSTLLRHNQEFFDLLFSEQGKMITQASLSYVFEALEAENAKILLILDGFDAVLRSPGVTRNWWDNLLDLARRQSLCLVTGSRAPLQDLCITEGSQTSNFWQIFGPKPERVTPFSGPDWEDVLAPFQEAGLRIEQAARQEVENWTGGIPLLTVGLLHRIYAACEGQEVLAKSLVDESARLVLDEDRSLLDALWADCSETLRHQLTRLAASGGEVSAASIPKDGTRELAERGFAVEKGQNRLKSTARLVSEFAKDQASSVNTLRSLFATPEDYLENTGRTLQLRLQQLQGVDPQLRVLLERALRDLSAPEEEHRGAYVLLHFRSIADRAMQLIWEAELPQKPTLPDDWTPRVDPNQYWGGVLPSGRRPQRALLSRATSTEFGPAVARYASRATSILVDAVGSAGDFGQHLDGDVVPLGFALAACNAAIELVNNLAQELRVVSGIAQPITADNG